jgi:hypothetical protein
MILLLTVFLSFAFLSCTMPPPDLPKNRLPRRDAMIESELPPAANAPATQQGTSSSETQPPRIAQITPPAFAEIPPNTSQIMARVIKRSVWPPGSLANVVPAVRPDRTMYSVTIQIETSAPAIPSVSSLAQVGSVIEAFSSEKLPEELVGKKIGAVLELTGNTQGTRWVISEIRVDPSAGGRK